MNYTPKLGGYVVDAPSTEDYKFEDNLMKIESAGLSQVETGGVLDLRRWCSPIEDQGHVGSCVGNSVVGALEFLMIRNGIPYVDLSRLFVYYNSRLMHQSQDRDSGTYIRMAMGTLSSLGTCTEAKWPYDVSKVFIRPSWGSYREAYPHKIDSYYSISGRGQTRIDYIKKALAAQHVVVFGMTVDQSYMDYRGGIVAMPKRVRVNSGGHAQVIVGYDDNAKCWIVRNSWGTWWGDAGYGYVPYEYLDASDASDFWVPFLPGTGAENG